MLQNRKEGCMMNKLLVKAKENKWQILLTIIFGCFPLICAMIYSILGKHGISDVYLPASYWNDELMYYKQVEAVVNFGIPQGWFGYQETHGSVFPFAVWSPAVLVPWIVWGVFFGWELTSPVYANIAYNIIAMVFFVSLVKPTRKQSIFVLGLLAVFTPYSRFLLSGMPESIYMSMGIWMAALLISINREYKCWKLIVMFVISILITLGRPYLGLFMFFPMWFLLKKKKWIGGIISCAIAGFTALGYVMLTKLCCATYIIPSIETEWLESFINNGVTVGFDTLFGIIYEKFKLLITYHFIHGIKFGLFSGALYTVAGVITFLLTLRCVWAFIQGKDRSIREFCLIQSVITIGMVGAIFLFYRLGEGAKHLMIFIVLGIILIALLREKFYLIKLITIVICLYFFVIKAWAPFDWQVAYDDGGLRKEVDLLKEQLNENMILEDTDDRYDDTIIWLASDIINGESITANWGLLYAIPEGFGLNFCTQDYVMEHIDELKSAYIAVLPEGEVDKIFQGREMLVVGEVEHMKVYKLR